MCVNEYVCVLLWQFVESFLICMLHYAFIYHLLHTLRTIFVISCWSMLRFIRKYVVLRHIVSWNEFIFAAL